MKPSLEEQELEQKMVRLLLSIVPMRSIDLTAEEDEDGEAEGEGGDVGVSTCRKVEGTVSSFTFRQCETF